MRLGKTATSRTRRKQINEDTGSRLKNTALPQDAFTSYLLRKNYSDMTIASFREDVERFNAWLAVENMEAVNVGYNDITGFLQSFDGITQQTKACYLRGVKQYFNFLIQQGERTDNPAEFIQLRGLKRKTLYDILSRQELDNLYHHYRVSDASCYSRKFRPDLLREWSLLHKRNKAVLGLMLYQGLDARDLKLLAVGDVKLREGKICIPGTRKSDERELKLEALQIIDLMEYIQHTRKELLQIANKETEDLFMSMNENGKVRNISGHLLRRLQPMNKKLTTIKQLRASVIVHWLKLYNLREVQYMAGHRYVSSTENFLVNDMDEMIEDIDKYHPVG